MATLQENVQRIKAAKEAIKTAIIDKGVDVRDETLDKYPDLIAAIQGGGVGGKHIGTLRVKETLNDDTFVSMGLADLDTSEVTDVSNLFLGCVNIRTIDLTAWNMVAVEKSSLMFHKCSNLASVIGQKTITDVDGGLSALGGITAPVDVSYTKLDLASCCAIINGLGEAKGSVAVNFSTEQYNAIEAYRDGHYIAVAKEKGWIVCHNGYSDELLADECAGTIIGHDADGNIKYVKYEDFVKDDFDTTTFDPVAVVVIPRSHCNDGKCRGMSLRYMSCATPEDGVNNKAETMPWGPGAIDEVLKNYSSATTGNVEIGGSLGVNTISYLPNDILSGTPSIVDTVGGIAQSYYGTATPYCPSPYGPEGIVNPQYRNGSPANAVQANTDMNGEANTRMMIDAIISKVDTNVLVPDSGAIGNISTNYPAFTTTYRYRGGGYNDWYLPSAGEAGYLVVRIGAIDRSLLAIRTKYGTAKATSTSRNEYHNTSNEHGSKNSRNVIPGNGAFDFNGGKEARYIVRAFRAF